MSNLAQTTQPERKTQEDLAREESQAHASFVRDRIEQARLATKVAVKDGSEGELAKLEKQRDDLTDRLGIHVARTARDMQRENPDLTITEAMLSAVRSLN